MSASGELELQVSKDGMSAVLSIPPALDPQWLTRELCVATLEAESILLNADLLQRLDEAIGQHQADPAPGQKVLIQGTPPRNGANGSLEIALRPAHAPTDEGEAEIVGVDHYAKSTFVLVEPGQVIGQVTEPDSGDDGADVRGTVVPAKPGRPVNLALDDSILLDARGRLTAQVSGALEQIGHKLKINRILTVERFVDFETGHVNFDGDVEVMKGVRDCFEVNARGSAIIRGLVEGATLRTGIDLTLAGGMAAKEKGVIQVGRDCRAKYLDHVEGRVAHDLYADREIINCRLEVHGQLLAPRGELIGGELHCLRQATLKELGSVAGVKTVLCLGSAPVFERVLAWSQTHAAKLQDRVREIITQIDTIQKSSRTMATSTKEQITELMCEQMEAEEKHRSIAERSEKVRAYFERVRRPQVQVLGTIHHGTTIVFGQTAATFREDQRGPITVTADHHGELCIRHGDHGELRSIRSVAELTLWKSPSDQSEKRVA